MFRFAEQVSHRRASAATARHETLSQAEREQYDNPADHIGPKNPPDLPPAKTPPPQNFENPESTGLLR